MSAYACACVVLDVCGTRMYRFPRSPGAHPSDRVFPGNANDNEMCLITNAQGIHLAAQSQLLAVKSDDTMCDTLRIE